MNQLNVIPSYIDLSVIHGSTTATENWKIRTRYNSNAGTDIYIQGLRLNMGECLSSISQINVGDILTVRYKPANYARVDGRVLEIVKNKVKICNYENSAENVNKEYRLGKLWMSLFSVLAVFLLTYSFIKPAPR